WSVPPWIGSGQPVLPATHTREYNGHLGRDRFVEVLRRGANPQVAPALTSGIVTAVLTVVSKGGRSTAVDRLIVWLAGLIVGWWAIVAGMTLAGYPGLERFYLPAA